MKIITTCLSHHWGGLHSGCCLSDFTRAESPAKTMWVFSSKEDGKTPKMEASPRILMSEDLEF